MRRLLGPPHLLLVKGKGHDRLGILAPRALVAEILIEEEAGIGVHQYTSSSSARFLTIMISP
ncbi:MAG: hypothetical protein ACOVOI_15015, partial [Hyphomicrobiales bacterium]